MNELPSLEKFETLVEHIQVPRGEIKLHVAVAGQGPLLLFLHGFPDHWLTWHRQMAAFMPTHRVAAMDLRGFNLSGQPREPAAYAVEHLVGDVEAVIEACGSKDAVLVGHDWGGWLAWMVAMMRPKRVRALAVVNMPHPWAIARELSRNRRQQAASAYVRAFQQAGAERAVPVERLAQWITDPAYRTRHDAAMARTDFGATLNYYRVHFPAPPYAPRDDVPPLVHAPTLIVHGLADPYALPEGLNDVWNWIDAPATIEAWPGIGHFVQHEVPERLNQALSRFVEASGQVRRL